MRYVLLLCPYWNKLLVDVKILDSQSIQIFDIRKYGTQSDSSGDV